MTNDSKRFEINFSDAGCGCFIVLAGLALFVGPLIKLIEAIKQ